jgi:16S rRNA (guanine527-N7)-methyltransferase
MSAYDVSLLADTAAAWGWALSHEQCDQFITYATELRHWNERINLTSITDPADIIRRHFLDSLVCARHWGSTPHNLPYNLIDIGSGAGFPGVPLKLLYPDLRLTLVESVGKKAAFLRHLVDVLALRDTLVLQERIETVGRDPQQRESYDVATARAVAALPVLAEYALPLLRIGGRLLAPKGENILPEVESAQRALSLLGGQLLRVEPVALPEQEPRTLVIVAKIAPTPAAYPRAVGVPARRQLS